MTSAGTERAARVCNTCKLRKKACSKQLPSCDYCTKRGLICTYQDSPSHSSSDTTTSSTSTTVSFQPWQRYDLGVSGHGWSDPYSLLLQLGSFSNLSPGSDAKAFGEIVDLQFRRILDLADLSVYEFSQRYLRHFHRWLPVIPPRVLHEISAKDQCIAPPTDLSVLLFAMCLVTLYPATGTSERLSSPESLYVIVRMLYGHAQAVICASTDLLRAGLLIAAYEYASGRPDAAYISMGTCVKMAYTLGLDREDETPGSLHHRPISRLEALERWNLWWCVVILERVIMIELDYRKQQPFANFPSIDSHLPSDIGICHQLQSGLPNAELLDTPLLSMMCTGNMSNFGRQAQAVHLLDQILHTIRLPSEPETKLAELMRLDGELRSFLIVLMGECDPEPGISCGAMATTIRSFFILHEDMLAQLRTSTTSVGGVEAQSSQAALNTAANIMVDVAHDHMKHKTVDELPLCCSYQLRVAMKCIEDQRMSRGDEEISRELEPLLSLDKAFYQRWRTARTSHTELQQQ